MEISKIGYVIRSNGILPDSIVKTFPNNVSTILAMNLSHYTFERYKFYNNAFSDQHLYNLVMTGKLFAYGTALIYINSQPVLYYVVYENENFKLGDGMYTNLSHRCLNIPIKMIYPREFEIVIHQYLDTCTTCKKFTTIFTIKSVKYCTDNDCIRSIINFREKLLSLGRTVLRFQEIQNSFTPNEMPVCSICRKCRRCQKMNRKCARHIDCKHIKKNNNYIL